MWSIKLNYSLLLTTVIILRFVRSNDNVSFKDVTLEWRSGDQHQSVKIKSSNSLKENVPEKSEISIKINGVVPVLYENAATDLRNVSSLTLDSLGLEDVKPGAFKHLQINRLSLSYNKFEELHHGVFEDVSVTILQIFNSGLRRIESETFENIRGLRYLTLSNNELEEISPEVFNNPTLTDLDLDFNSVSVLRPGDLINLPSLRSLQLTSNKIKEVPEGVFNNMKITHLKLNYNEISKIATKAFDDMPVLSVLHIDHNKLTRWDNNWLHNSPKINYVIAGFNQIEEIPEEAFKNYPKVYSIDLQNNRIKLISPDSLKSSKSVVNFNLNNNEIHYWDEHTLGNVSISTVFLENNKIECINGDLKKVFKTVYFGVSLYGNPWNDKCPTKVDYIESPGSPPKIDDL